MTEKYTLVRVTYGDVYCSYDTLQEAADGAKEYSEELEEDFEIYKLIGKTTTETKVVVSLELK